MDSTTRRLGTLAGAAVTAFALAACSGSSGGSGAATSSGDGGEPVSGGTLNMLGSGDVDYMDPNVTYYSLGYQSVRLWSRQLFTFPAEEGKSTTAVPDLAEAIPTQGNGISEDGKTYTITLRQGVQWNTEPARQVTAQDVVRGVKRTCNPAQPFGGLPNYLGLIEGMADFCDGFAEVKPEAAPIAKYINDTDLPGVQAQDDSTVVFTLTKPASYFVDMLTLPAFSAAPEEWDAYVPASAELAQNTISDGPYQITAYTPTEEHHLRAQPGLERRQRPGPQGLRRHDRRQRDGEPGLDPAAAGDRHPERRHAVGQPHAGLARPGARGRQGRRS